MTLNELCKQAHEASKAKGWYEGRERHPLEFHMLIVSEVAEASEEVRNNKPAVYVVNEDGSIAGVSQVSPECFVRIQGKLEGGRAVRIDTPIKPEGEAVELADAVIRVADYFEKQGWDLEAVVKAKMAYNATRPHRHGGKAL